MESLWISDLLFYIFILYFLERLDDGPERKGSYGEQNRKPQIKQSVHDVFVRRRMRHHKIEESHQSEQAEQDVPECFEPSQVSHVKPPFSSG